MSRAFLLLLRFFAVNIAAFAVLTYVWMEGWITMIVNQDMTRITLVVAGVFVFGWLLCGYKIIRCSHQLNAILEPVKYGPSRAQWYIDLTRHIEGSSRTALANCLRSRLYSRISVIRLIANNLITLGLIGTVIGIIIASNGVEAQQVADVTAVAPMLSTLIQGMSIALYTTLVGAVCHVWLLMCYQILATGTVNLANAIIEYSEVPHIHDNKEVI